MNTRRRQLRLFMPGGARPSQVRDGLVDATLPVDKMVTLGRGSEPEVPPAPK